MNRRNRTPINRQRTQQQLQLQLQSPREEIKINEIKKEEVNEIPDDYSPDFVKDKEQEVEMFNELEIEENNGNHTSIKIPNFDWVLQHNAYLEKCCLDLQDQIVNLIRRVYTLELKLQKK